MKPTLLISHAAAMIIISGIILLIYASVQQAHRSAANDPQIQIARDISNALNEDKSIKSLVPADTIDIAESFAVFAEIFDRTGKPIQSTGLLNGAALQPPQGIFDFTKANDEDVLTWQPQKDVRMAMVFEKVNSPYVGFVAVGRSLKETEVRESNLVKMIGIAWIACMAVLLLHLLAQVYLDKKTNK